MSCNKSLAKEPETTLRPQHVLSRNGPLEAVKRVKVKVFRELGRVSSRVVGIFCTYSETGSGKENRVGNVYFANDAADAFVAGTHDLSRDVGFS